MRLNNKNEELGQTWGSGKKRRDGWNKKRKSRADWCLDTDHQESDFNTNHQGFDLNKGSQGFDLNKGSQDFDLDYDDVCEEGLPCHEEETKKEEKITSSEWDKRYREIFELCHQKYTKKKEFEGQQEIKSQRANTAVSSRSRVEAQSDRKNWHIANGDIVYSFSGDPKKDRVTDWLIRIFVAVMTILVIGLTWMSADAQKRQEKRRQARKAAEFQEQQEQLSATSYNDNRQERVKAQAMPSDIIKKRVEERKRVSLVPENQLTYRQMFPLQDDAKMPSEQKTNGKPYRYYVMLDSIKWLFPGNTRDPEERYQLENHVKRYVGHRLNQLLYSYLKDKYKKILKGDPYLCLDVTYNIESDFLHYTKVETSLPLNHKQKVDLYTYLQKASSPKDDSDIQNTFTSRWCFTLYHYDQERISHMTQIPVSDAYPNVVIKSTQWRHDAPKTIKNIQNYQLLLENKLEQIRQDIGVCLSQDPETEVSFTMDLRVMPSGGPVLMEKIASSNEKNSTVLRLDKCLRMGTVLPTLINDVPVRTETASDVQVEFEVRPPGKA